MSDVLALFRPSATRRLMAVTGCLVLATVSAGCIADTEAPTPPQTSKPGVPASPQWSEVAGTGDQGESANPEGSVKESAPQGSAAEGSAAEGSPPKGSASPGQAADGSSAAPPAGDATGPADATGAADAADPADATGAADAADLEDWDRVVDAVPAGTAQGCQDTTTPFSCGGKFRAILGRDAGNPVEWIDEGTTRIEAVRMGGKDTLIVLSPCNTLNIPVTITQGAITPSTPFSTAMGCDPSDVDAERWLTDLLTNPVAFHFRGPENLVLTNDTKEIVLARV